MKKTKKAIILLVSLTVLMTSAIGVTLALLTTQDGPLYNIFNPSEITTEIFENTDNHTKSNVKIQNTGDTEAYIRAAVVITWQDETGNVYGQKPVEEADYTIAYAMDHWELGADGFFYYKKPVAAKGYTGTLIATCSYKANAPEGYSLNVEIIASGIQSKPTHVVTTEWQSGVASVNDNGTLIIK